jgi:MGT family glycosyltransferase
VRRRDFAVIWEAWGVGRSRDQLRFVVAAFGDAGHAFPAIALARELQRRGHEVLVESWEEWQGAVEGEGLRFEAAQQYMVFPPPSPDTPQGQIVARAARALAGLMGEFEPDLVVSDILTRAPALAAEVAGVPGATLIPHVYPVQRPGQPMYSMGFQPARTPLGRAGWRATMPLLNVGLRQGRDELNETRERLGLAPQDRFHGGISELLAIVATFPQLEYPRVWAPYAHVSGPLFFELPTDGVEIPDGEGPLVVIAPSTAQDPECEMLRAALEGLAEEPVRVLATTNRRAPNEPIEVPANAVLLDWLPYSQAMAAGDLVISHGGHGTAVRALSLGAPLLVCPAVGDMAENGARVAWSGAGLSLPRRLLSPRRIRLAARRILGDPSYRERAEEMQLWSRANDGAERAAVLAEEAARNATSRLSPARS